MKIKSKKSKTNNKKKNRNKQIIKIINSHEKLTFSLNLFIIYLYLFNSKNYLSFFFFILYIIFINDHYLNKCFCFF